MASRLMRHRKMSGPGWCRSGQDRGGFYSYDWLERLFGAQIHNVDEIRPEWQKRAGGDFVRATQPGYLGGLLGEDLGWYVTEVQANRALVLHYWGAFVLQENGRGGTRLLIRSTTSNRHIPSGLLRSRLPRSSSRTSSWSDGCFSASRSAPRPGARQASARQRRRRGQLGNSST